MKVAGIQCDIQIGDKSGNLDLIESTLRQLAQQDVELVVFPECATTGYCFDSRESGLEVAESVPGPATDRIGNVCRETGQFAVFGSLEAADEGLFNVALLVGPDGLIAKYRKSHLPYLGVDRFTDYGAQPYEVHDIGPLRIGLLICYDAAFPEATRSLALAGADLVVLPTNWPPGAEQTADYVINARSMENAIYFMAVNRVGDERGFTFIGKSRICRPNGDTIVAADHRQPEILVAEIDADQARQKRVTRVPGQHAIDRMADRRPDLYGRLTELHQLPRPGRPD